MNCTYFEILLRKACLRAWAVHLQIVYMFGEGNGSCVPSTQSSRKRKNANIQLLDPECFRRRLIPKVDVSDSRSPIREWRKVLRSQRSKRAVVVFNWIFIQDKVWWMEVSQKDPEESDLSTETSFPQAISWFGNTSSGHRCKYIVSFSYLNFMDILKVNPISSNPNSLFADGIVLINSFTASPQLPTLLHL